MTAREDQPQPVVRDPAVVNAWFPRERQDRDLLQLGRARRGAAEPIERPVACRRGQPRTRIAGDAVARPAFQRPRDGILRTLLRDVPIAGQADQGRDDAAPLLTERPGDRGLDGLGYISQIGLTSTVPTRAPGILAAISMASSRSLQSTTK